MYWSEHRARWASYGGWSGVAVRGRNSYICSSRPDEYDVVIAAIAAPEGGNYDEVNSYDGTALTWGLAQWTFTSGRLQALLGAVRQEANSAVNRCGVIEALFEAGVTLEADGRLRHRIRRHVVSSTRELRALLTPPNGRVPKAGKCWRIAKRVALAFAALGCESGIDMIQERFLCRELRDEAYLKRPRLHGATIAAYLYWDDDPGCVQETIAARALFWSMWQNSPRAAESHLRRALRPEKRVDAAALDKLARVFAHSTTGNWGNAKAKAKGRRSRYWKVAREINRVMDRTLLDPNL